AVRICRTAKTAGIDLSGTRFTLTGEPLTAARLAVIRSVGATAGLTYASMESGALGESCLSAEAPDEVHLLHDRVAVIQANDSANGMGQLSGALLISLISPASPFVMLNVALGDRADVLQRRCGCPLEELGWTTHLRNIRSFEKLTAGGMTFLDVDVIEVLENELPLRFG